MFIVKKGTRLFTCHIILLTVFLLCFSGCSLDKKGRDNGDTDVDLSLETALREQLGKIDGVLTGEDWARLEVVKILGRSIIDLNALQSAENLRELNLRRNEISDLTPLSDLSHLEVLILADNKIEDISSLNGAVLAGLKHLDLSINRIDDLTVLDWDQLKALTHLDIRYNYIRLQDRAVEELLRDLAARGVEVLSEPMY